MQERGTDPPTLSRVSVRATPLELASGTPVGEIPCALPDDVGPEVSARAALEDAIRPWLVGPGRCCTGFSGGRDSSAILAVAVLVARREGLPAPVPITLRYRGAPDADESMWQELVVRHLKVADWVRIDVDDELDYLGPRATRLLRLHGVLWPPYYQYEHALLEQAAGGVLLSGHDGDGVFGSFPWADLSAVWHRRRRPNPADLVSLARLAAPRRLRRWKFCQHPLSHTWLRPPVRAGVQAGLAAEVASQPGRWDRWVPWLARRRSLALALSTIDLLAEDCGAHAAHPFLDPRFLAALANQGGPTGLGERTDMMQALFADILPGEMIRRKAKSNLGGGFWRDASRSFAAQWDGQGVDEAMVDPDALRTAWTVFRPKMGAVALLQTAWLATASSGTGSHTRLDG